MKCYIYIGNQEGDDLTKQAAIRTYVEHQQLANTVVVQDADLLKVHWQKRPIGALLGQSGLQAKDQLVVYSAASLACSTAQLIEILFAALRQQVAVHFVQYGMTFTPNASSETLALIALLKEIDQEFVMRRTTDALQRRRENGLPLGRPKGSKNRALKLDQHQDDILRYLKLRVSRASIAKLIGCHPQTLYDWLDRKHIDIANIQQQALETTRVKSSMRNKAMVD